MTARRLLIAVSVAVLAVATGCRSWCERSYPCQTPVVAAPAPTTACVPCQPCCVPATAPAAVPAVPAPPPTWNAPRTGTCVCPP
jgi:hypothetical protein